MNKQDRQREKFLAETFYDDWERGSAAGYAQAAAAAARRRQKKRRAVFATVAAAGAAAVVMLSIRRPLDLPISASPIPVVRTYEVISDDELLSELRDRTLLVRQQANGAREFLVLDN